MLQSTCGADANWQVDQDELDEPRRIASGPLESHSIIYALVFDQRYYVAPRITTLCVWALCA